MGAVSPTAGGSGPSFPPVPLGEDSWPDSLLTDPGSETRPPPHPRGQKCGHHPPLRSTTRDTRTVCSVAMEEQVASGDFLLPNRWLLFPKMEPALGKGTSSHLCPTSVDPGTDPLAIGRLP